MRTHGTDFAILEMCGKNNVELQILSIDLLRLDELLGWACGAPPTSRAYF